MIGSCTEHFLLFPRNFFSFIQYMEFIMLEMLFGVYCLLINKRRETYAEVLR